MKTWAYAQITAVIESSIAASMREARTTDKTERHKQSHRDMALGKFVLWILLAGEVDGPQKEKDLKRFLQLLEL